MIRGVTVGVGDYKLDGICARVKRNATRITDARNVLCPTLIILAIADETCAAPRVKIINALPQTVVVFGQSAARGRRRIVNRLDAANRIFHD